jgi:hypothetical protein
VHVAERHRVEIERQGDVLVITFRGLYHFAAHLEVRALALREISTTPVRAAVLDLRDAVMMLDEAGREAVAELAAASSRGRTPVAIVVKPRAFDVTASLCALMLEHGFYWVPFLDPDDAAHWAASRRGHRLRQAP